MGGYVGLLQALSCGMADKDDLSERLDWLLRESGAVREASEELVREAKRLRHRLRSITPRGNGRSRDYGANDEEAPRSRQADCGCSGTVGRCLEVP